VKLQLPNRNGFFQTPNRKSLEARDLALAVAFGVNSRRLQRQGGSFQVSHLLQNFKE
jgi:hypothetical protein